MSKDNVAAVRLLHVASSYPLDDQDSHAPFMEEMLAALARLGHQVSVIVPRVAGLEEGLRNGVRVIGVPYAPRPLQLWGYGRSIRNDGRVGLTAIALTPFAIASMMLRVVTEILTNRPDLVHLHWVIPQGVLVPLIPRKIPIVVSVHGADMRLMLGPLRRIARYSMRRAIAVITASNQVRSLVAEVSPEVSERLHVIPHGANSELFTNQDSDSNRLTLGLPSDKPIVVAVGRLVPKKGFSQLIEAMSVLEDMDAHLYVVGDGPERRHLERLAVGSHGRVHLMGAQDRADVARWLSAADVVAIPGVQSLGDIDTGPVVLVEALASGRPVVVTRVGMAPDVIEHGVNGFLVDDADPARLAEALRSALQAGGGLGLEARRTFEDLGDWSRVARNLEEIYRTRP